MFQYKRLIKFLTKELWAKHISISYLFALFYSYIVIVKRIGQSLDYEITEHKCNLL